MKRKPIVVFCGFLLIFSLLYMRVGSLSLNQDLLNVGAQQSSYSISFNKTRGQIYDCNLRPLVDVERKYVASVLPCPQNIMDITNSSVLKQKSDISETIKKAKPFITECTLPKVNIKQVEVFSIPKRYEKEQLAQHVVGYIDTSSNSGLTGVEKAFNDVLSKDSQSSNVSYRLDGRGNPLLGAEPLVSLAPIRDDGVVLTIDKRIQKICEESGARHLKKGAIVVMEPSTGKLKAVASFPSYNTQNLSSAIKDEKNSPLLNRAFSAYTVGSTFKLVTAATALSQGISPETTFYCNGKTEIGDVSFGCHEKNGHGKLNMKGAMAVSCNPYFINLSTLISKDRFINMASDLSFGKQIEFAKGLKTVSGHLPTVGELHSPASVANMSFGQGTLTATPVQVAQMVSAIVNDGNTMPAMLIEGLTNDGKILYKKANENFPVRAMEKNIAQTLKEYMVHNVMDMSGQNAKPYHTTAGGKTGTAQTGQMNGKEELLHGWFAGFYPADKPKYVIVVLAEDARSGNQDASPIFREIVDTLTAPIVIPKELRDNN